MGGQKLAVSTESFGHNHYHFVTAKTYLSLGFITSANCNLRSSDEQHRTVWVYRYRASCRRDEKESVPSKTGAGVSWRCAQSPLRCHLVSISTSTKQGGKVTTLHLFAMQRERAPPTISIPVWWCFSFPSLLKTVFDAWQKFCWDSTWEKT